MKNSKVAQTEFKQVRPHRIIYPILIGFAVIAYLLYREFDPTVFTAGNIHFTGLSVVFILLAMLCMVGRDFGYMIRIRVLSDNVLTWRQAFRIIMLWEFTSAVTPSSTGGTSVALLYVHREGISVGRSAAIVMLTSLLDELYFVVLFPLLVLLVGPALFNIADSGGWTYGLLSVAILGYTIKLVWLLLMIYGLFINARGFSKLVYRVFHLPFLRRWKRGAGKAANDIILASAEMKTKNMKYWRNAVLSTFLSWTSRYWVVNFLFLAFFAVNDHFLIFARQLVMSIILLVSPTPGGSGVAEVMFSEFLGDFIPIAGFAVVLVLLWRVITYYPYLVIGAVIFPKWLAKHK